MRIWIGGLLAVAAAAGLAKTLPDDRVEHWAPPGVASALFESHPAFDPRTGDLYFVRSAKDFSGWHLLMSRCGAEGWTKPVPPPFAAAGLEADPWFAPDGRSLYFISTRATGAMRSNDLDIWRVDRRGNGRWGEPVRLPAPVNSPHAEWFPRLASDGWLYFGSNRPGGLGRTDIWRARKKAGGSWTIENLGPAINSAGNEYEALPSPDGRLLVVAADDGLYLSRRVRSGWSAKARLGPGINVDKSAIGALFSPSGRSMLFARDTGEPRSGEFFVWRLRGREAWPPACPARAMVRPPRAASAKSAPTVRVERSREASAALG